MKLQKTDWELLEDAYGAATSIPGLIEQLETAKPARDWQSEPYCSLSSALCHQGDVFTASYAAVPFLVDLCKRKPASADFSVLQLVCSIEIARLSEMGPPIPDQFRASYSQAISALPQTAVDMLNQQKGHNEAARTSSMAVAVSAGNHSLAEAIGELSDDVLEVFFDWLSER